MQWLLPNLGLLRHQLEHGKPDEHKRSTIYSLELLPYSLGATYQAFLDFANEEQVLVDATMSKFKDKGNIVAIGGGGRDRLCYKIDSFLEAARRAQNAVIPYISKAKSISLPSSLADLVKRIEKKKIKLSDDIVDDILGYWTNQGEKLKHYRDLSQHHALVASEVRVFTSSDSKPAIYIALPRNPEVKDPSQLSFDDPPILAFHYLHEQLRWLIRFCHVITTKVTIPPGPQRAVTSTILFRAPMRLGTGAKVTGHYIQTESEIVGGIKCFVESLGRL